MQSHQLINQTSGQVEYYTPQAIIEAARAVMGEIDMDPASSRAANARVKARDFFDEGMDGMLTPWGSQNHPNRVWLNHPFGKAEPPCPQGCDKNHFHHKNEYYGNRRWIQKLMDEYAGGRVCEAMCITYACTSEKWFQPLLEYPQCFINARTNYVLPDGTVKKGVTKGSVITYLGRRPEEFNRAFRQFGKIKVNWVIE